MSTMTPVLPCATSLGIIRISPDLTGFSDVISSGGFVSSPAPQLYLPTNASQGTRLFSGNVGGEHKNEGGPSSPSGAGSGNDNRSRKAGPFTLLRAENITDAVSQYNDLLIALSKDDCSKVFDLEGLALAVFDDVPLIGKNNLPQSITTVRSGLIMLSLDASQYDEAVLLHDVLFNLVFSTTAEEPYVQHVQRLNSLWSRMLRGNFLGLVELESVVHELTKNISKLKKTNLDGTIMRRLAADLKTWRLAKMLDREQTMTAARIEVYIQQEHKTGQSWGGGRSPSKSWNLDLYEGGSSVSPVGKREPDPVKWAAAIESQIDLTEEKSKREKK
ncbi:MAG: hypothetical protein ABH871_06740 [Pseudomonadota bacterium]